MRMQGTPAATLSAAREDLRLALAAPWPEPWCASAETPSKTCYRTLAARPTGGPAHRRRGAEGRASDAFGRRYMRAARCPGPKPRRLLLDRVAEEHRGRNRAHRATDPDRPSRPAHGCANRRADAVSAGDRYTRGPERDRGAQAGFRVTLTDCPASFALQHRRYSSVTDTFTK